MAESLDAPSWEQVKPLLAKVLEQPAARQRAMAERLAGADTALREELLSLLDACAGSEVDLHTLPAEMALRAVRAELERGLEERPDTRSLAGQRVGAWRLVSLIARGGQGDVYRAERAEAPFTQLAAVKILRARLDNDSFVARFAAERQLLAGLDHPNLARVLDGGATDDGIPYFVMELVDGEPIDRWCRRMGVPLSERLALFRTVCQVVGYAHGKGIVHRDLKCDNILVTPSGAVKLVDFGLAKQLSVPTETTATAQRMMTLAYCSPEQLRGGAITPASDVYSLGVVLYRLLTGIGPYAALGADSGYELTRAICETEPLPPSRATGSEPALDTAQRRRLRGDLDALVMMALRKDPARRYADALAMGEDVLRHLENLPVQARRGAWSYRLNRYVLRHRAVVGAIMAANLALLVGLGVALQQGVEARKQRARAEASLATVREFANVLLFDVYQAISKLSGATPARKLVVDKALAYLQKVGADMHANPALQLEVAIAYRRLADIQGEPHNANLGDVSGATANYRRALELLDTLEPARLQTAAQRSARQSERVLIMNTLSRVLLDHGDRARGLPLLERARVEGEASVTAQPDAIDVRMDLARTYSALAHVNRDDTATSVSLSWLDKAEAVLAPVLRAHPDQALALRLMAGLHFSRGDFYNDRQASGDVGRAIASFEASRAVFARLLALDPGNAPTKRDLAVSSVPYAMALRDQGRMELAESALRQSIASLNELIALDPADANLPPSLATCHGVLGDILVTAGKPHQAAAELRASITLSEGALGRMPKETMERINLGETYGNLAQAVRDEAGPADPLARARADKQACTLYDHAIELLSVPPPRPQYVVDSIATDTTSSAYCRQPAARPVGG